METHEGYTYSEPDEDNEICMDMRDDSCIYLTKKDLEDMLKLFVEYPQKTGV